MIARIKVDPFLDLFRTEPGYVGAFTRKQADGAISNGARVEKSHTEDGDTHPIGARATVLGSISADGSGLGIMYFVEWDAKPGFAVACHEKKLRRV